MKMIKMFTMAIFLVLCLMCHQKKVIAAIDGRGTTNYIPLFEDADTLKNSPIRVTNELLLIEGSRTLLIEGSIGIVGRSSYYGLDVNGPIRTQSESGGIEFPDGTVQTTAAVSTSHNHDDRYYTKIQLRTSGYAFVHWDNLLGIPPDIGNNGTVDNDWTVTGQDMFSATSGNVGIGTTTPDTKLEVQGGPIKATDGLIIEIRTSDPPNPITGQIWLRTDL